MDNKFSDTYIWADGKYSWTAWNKATGMGAAGQDRTEAEKTFRLNWGDRGEINWIEGPPPPPKREGERAPIEASSRPSISAAVTRYTSGCFTSSIQINTRARLTAPARSRPPSSNYRKRCDDRSTHQA